MSNRMDVDRNAVMTDPAEQLSNVEKLSETSKQILGNVGMSIERFVARFNEQKGGLTELYRKTQEHQHVVANVVAVRSCLQEILDLIAKENHVKNIINSNIETNFDAYMATMDEIRDAIFHLSKQQFGDARIAVGSLRGLQGEGKKSILAYFNSLIEKNSEPFNVTGFKLENGKFVTDQDLLRKDTSWPIPDEHIEKLAQMERVLTATGEKVQRNHYAAARSKFLEATLQPLLDAAVARTIRSSGDVLDIPTYRKQSHPLHRLAFTLDLLMPREAVIAQKIFGDDWAEPFGAATDMIFKTFIAKIDEMKVDSLNSHVDVLFDLDIIATLREISLSFQEVENGQGAHIIIQKRNGFIDCIMDTMKNFVQLVDKHDYTIIPPDGGVTPLTSNVILFLIDLCAYPDIQAEMKDLNQQALPVIAIEKLIENIKCKAKHYKDDIVLSHLFIINNAHYAYDAIQNSPLVNIVTREMMQAIEDITQKAQDQYMANTWSTAFAKLHLSKKEQDEFGTVKKVNGESYLTKKQKKMIKGQFKAFSTRINDITIKHQSYNTRNARVMAAIHNEATRLVTSEYEKFWAKWRQSGFSKTPEKWICYQPPTLISMISRLYGQGKA